MMSRLLKSGSVLAVLAAACTTIPTVDLYNYASSPVRVSVQDEVLSIAPRDMKSFDYPSKDWGEIAVCLGNVSLRYSIPYPPRGYYRVGLFRGRIRVQIDGDGQIWILRPDEDFPIEQNSQQPGPFPLPPQRTDGNCK